MIHLITSCPKEAHDSAEVVEVNGYNKRVNEAVNTIIDNNKMIQSTYWAKYHGNEPLDQNIFNVDTDTIALVGSYATGSDDTVRYYHIYQLDIPNPGNIVWVSACSSPVSITHEDSAELYKSICDMVISGKCIAHNNLSEIIHAVSTLHKGIGLGGCKLFSMLTDGTDVAILAFADVENFYETIKTNIEAQVAEEKAKISEGS